MAVKVACSYAMLCHVTKVALKDLAFGYSRTLSWPEHVTLTATFVAVTMVRPCLSRILFITLLLTVTSCASLDAVAKQAAAMAFGSDLQAAMAFSGILVVIMVAIFPGWLKLKM